MDRAAGAGDSRRIPRSGRPSSRRTEPGSSEPAADAAQAAAALLARKWVLPILVALAERPLRRFQLAVAISEVAPKVLTETLRLLEREGLVERVLVRESEVIVGIAYELTPLGRALDQPVRALARWSAVHDQARNGRPASRDRLGA